MPSPRVLLIAELCNPRMASVPLVGWAHARAIQRIADAHLATQVRNREALIKEGLVESKDFTAIDSEPIERPTWKLAEMLVGKGRAFTFQTAAFSLTYQYFERKVWQRFGQQIRARKFDVVHQITPLSPTIPAQLAGWCRSAGVPFVWGPLNGGMPWPKGFDEERRREGEWLSYVRGAYQLLPGCLATRRNAAAILVGSRETLRQMPRAVRVKCLYMPENGIDPQRFQRRRTRRASKPIRAIFVGRMVPCKGLDMLLDAAAPLLRSSAMRLDLVGDGPELPRLRAIIDREQLGDAVRTPGWVLHAQVQDWLVDSDVFTFPSIHEFGGGATLEAMAVGLVPLVLNLGGPGELVTDRSGIVLPMGTRDEVIARLRRALSDLAEHPEAIEAKSPVALARAHEQFSWSAKARQTLRVYEWVTRPTTVPKPVFPMPMPDPPEFDTHPADSIGPPAPPATSMQAVSV
jgi:glycosyltransferase involved in cell wall biosynthesis